MATWEDERDTLQKEVTLLEAELLSNKEELSCLPLGGPKSRPDRRRYLELKNSYINEALSKKEERLANVNLNIQLDRRIHGA